MSQPVAPTARRIVGPAFPPRGRGRAGGGRQEAPRRPRAPMPAWTSWRGAASGSSLIPWRRSFSDSPIGRDSSGGFLPTKSGSTVTRVTMCPSTPRLNNRTVSKSTLAFAYRSPNTSRLTAFLKIRLPFIARVLALRVMVTNVHPAVDQPPARVRQWHLRRSCPYATDCQVAPPATLSPTIAPTPAATPLTPFTRTTPPAPCAGRQRLTA